MKAVVAAFNQEKALVGAFSVITNLRMDFFEALMCRVLIMLLRRQSGQEWSGDCQHNRWGDLWPGRGTSSRGASAVTKKWDVGG